MEPSEPLYPFALALSYLEKCNDELRNWKRLRKAEKSDVTRHDYVRDEYKTHHRQAENFLRAIRKEARIHLPGEEEKLNELVAQLQKLSRDVSKERIKPDKANVESRKIQDSLGPLQEAVAIHQAILHTKNTESLGGRIVLGLDDYAPRLRKLGILPLEVDEDEKRFDINWDGAWGKIAPVVAIIVIIAGFQIAKFAVPTVRPEFRSSGKGEIRINCINRGTASMNIFLPWPQGIPGEYEGAPKGRSFGMLVYLRDSDSSEWTLFAESTGAWLYRDSEVLEAGPHIIEGKSSKTYELSLERLASHGGRSSEIRVDIVNGRGRIKHQVFYEPLTEQKDL